MPTLQSCCEVVLEERPRFENAPVVAPYRVSTIARFFSAQSVGFNPDPQHLDLGDELRYAEGSPPLLIDGYAPPGGLGLRAYANDLPWLLTLAGYMFTVTPGDGTAAVQTITITGAPTGGTFTLSFGGETTAPIPYNATAAQVQQALNALASMPYGVTCTGGPLPGTGIVVTFNWGGAQALITANSTGLTGGAAPAVNVANTTAGTGTVTDPQGRVLLTGSQKWVGTPRTAVGNLNAKTAQLRLAYVEEQQFFLGSGFGASDFSIDAAGAVRASLMGLYFQALDADPNLVPVYDTAAIPPLRRGDFSIPTWLAGTGETEDFTVTVSNPIERRKTLGSTSSYFPNRLERTGRTRIGGTMPKALLARADIDALISAGTFPVLARWITKKGIGATTQPYAAFLEVPSAQYVGGGAAENTNAPRTGGSFDWAGAFDEAQQLHSRWTIINALTSIASAGVGN